MNKPKHLATIEPEAVLKYQRPLTDREKYEIENTISKADGKPYQKYYVTAEQYNTNDKIFSNCNSILFINSGTVQVSVLGVVLQPAQSLEVQGNRGELDTTQYIVSFPTPQNVGNLLTVIRKLYI